MLALIDLGEPLGPLPAFVAPLVVLGLLASLVLWRRQARQAEAK